MTFTSDFEDYPDSPHPVLASIAIDAEGDKEVFVADSANRMFIGHMIYLAPDGFQWVWEELPPLPPLASPDE